MRWKGSSPTPNRSVLNLVTKPWSAAADGSLVAELVNTATLPAEMASANPIAGRALAEQPGTGPATGPVVYLADKGGWRQLDGLVLNIEDTDDQFLKPGLALRLRLRNGTPVPAEVTATANRAEMIVVVADSENVRDHERWQVVAFVTAAALASQP